MAPYWFFPLFAGFLILYSLISAGVAAGVRLLRQEWIRRHTSRQPGMFVWPDPPTFSHPAEDRSATTDRAWPRREGVPK